MFSGHITIQYMLCMYFMIKKIILEGFNDRGGAIVRGKRGKTSKIQNITKNTSLPTTYSFSGTSAPAGACRALFCDNHFLKIALNGVLTPDS